MPIVLRDEFTGTSGTLLTAHTPDEGTGAWAYHPGYGSANNAKLDGSGRAVCQNLIGNNDDAANSFPIPSGEGVYVVEAVFSAPSYDSHINTLFQIAIESAESIDGWVALSCTCSTSVAGPPSFQLGGKDTYASYLYPTAAPALPWTVRLEIDSITRDAKAYFNGTQIMAIVLTAADFHAAAPHGYMTMWKGGTWGGPPPDVGWRCDRVQVEFTAAPTPPVPDETSGCLVKDLLTVGVEQLHMTPGTPYVPAQPGRYSYETQEVCGWQTPGGGHYEQLTDSNGQTRVVWVPNNLPPPGGWVVSTWVCTTKQTPVWHPPIPAQAATPPTYYSTTHRETSFNLGWNAGARSIAIFTGDAAVHFTVPVSVVGVIVGMNIDDGTPVTYNGNTIDYGFYLARGTARIMRNGVMGAPLGAYANETVFRIERTGTGITWKMDGTSVGTATGALTGAGWLEAALYSGNDEVCNAAIETFSPPDLTTKHATIAGNLPYLTDFMSDRPYAEMHGNLPALGGELTQGLITPSYCVMSGELTIFSGYFTSLTGEVATIAGNLRPMEGLSADHPYATISGLLPPVDGYMLALEGNYRASLNGWAQTTSAMVSRSILVVSVLNKLTVGGVFTTQLKQTAEFFSHVTMADLWTVRSIQQAILWSRAVIQGVQATVIDGEGDIETWVINMEGDAFGTTQYQNFDFNSYAEIDGHFYGAGQGGLVLLEGDTDDGVPIQSVVSLGKLGSSLRTKKTFEECFLGLSSAGNMFVKVIAEGREFIYKTKAFDAEMQVQRATFGKALRTNYVTLEIYNEEGADFELDSVQFVVADLVRKT